MSKVTLLPIENMDQDFIQRKYIPSEKTECELRDTQAQIPQKRWRQLTAAEIERLRENNNVASCWNNIWVTDIFDASLLKNNTFYGLVRIGDISRHILQFDTLKLPVGITDSTLVSCDIGNQVAIHNVHYLAHCIIGDTCILSNIQEMTTTDCATFGNGIVKDEIPEKEPLWIDVMNEAGGRRILPFNGMIAADAYIWAKYVDDKNLQKRLVEITQNTCDSRRSFYSCIGDHTVIKNAVSLQDVIIGAHGYIKGVNKLENVTVNSSQEEPTLIGEGVMLTDGIVGYGCHVSSSAMAIRFVLGNRSNLKYGARLIHSFLGDNSTIACCEVLNNLIFPAHEQHHNNSFLIATVTQGQSNIAAGATIGSNHNSRSNDNEVQAARGFWPGLCSSIKHASRFASYTLLSKADFPSEMDIPFPFALVNNNTTSNELEVMPAYWWMYNMYALIRNSWKYQSRDKRIRKEQHIEYSPFAPDTMNEALHSRKLLEKWTAKAWLREQEKNISAYTGEELEKLGKTLLNGSKTDIEKLTIFGENIEKGNRNVHLLKVYEAYRAYGDMLWYYGVTNLISYFEHNPTATLASAINELNNKTVAQSEWINLGGQLMAETDVDMLRADIVCGKLNSWEQIHIRYNDLWKQYPLQKQQHAYSVLCYMLETETLCQEEWKKALEHSLRIQQYIADQTYYTRQKDYENPFLKCTFRNEAEKVAVLGTLEENAFIIQLREETALFIARVQAWLHK